MVYVSFVVFPGFPMLAHALACEALLTANRLSPDPIFRFDTRVPGHQPATAGNGAILAPDRPNWDGAEEVDLALVLCGEDVPQRIPNGFQAFLARVEDAGGRLGGIAGGAVILARMGRLDGVRAVVPVGADHGSPPPYPGIIAVDAAFHLGDRRLTAASGMATAAAICAWIGAVATPALGQEVVRAMLTGPVAPADPSGREVQAPDEGPPRDPVIAAMEAQMRAHLEMPLALTEIAESLGLSRKALRGRCERALGVTPSEHYLSLRLGHGADLLRHTAMPISEIARASGFETLAGFSRAISAAMGVSPSTLRKLARAARKG